MDQNDWLPVPNLICRRCGALLNVTATEKRPVTEFYALHPKGICPLRLRLGQTRLEGSRY